MRPTDYVLGRFSDEEVEKLTPWLESASEMIERFLVEGLSSAQNLYHNSEFGLESENT